MKRSSSGLARPPLLKGLLDVLGDDALAHHRTVTRAGFGVRLRPGTELSLARVRKAAEPLVDASFDVVDGFFRITAYVDGDADEYKRLRSGSAESRRSTAGAVYRRSTNERLNHLAAIAARRFPCVEVAHRDDVLEIVVPFPLASDLAGFEDEAKHFYETAVLRARGPNVVLAIRVLA